MHGSSTCIQQSTVQRMQYSRVHIMHKKEAGRKRVAYRSSSSPCQPVDSGMRLLGLDFLAGRSSVVIRVRTLVAILRLLLGGLVDILRAQLRSKSRRDSWLGGALTTLGRSRLFVGSRYICAFAFTRGGLAGSWSSLGVSSRRALGGGLGRRWGRRSRGVAEVHRRDLFLQFREMLAVFILA